MLISALEPAFPSPNRLPDGLLSVLHLTAFMLTRVAVNYAYDFAATAIEGVFVLEGDFRGRREPKSGSTLHCWISLLSSVIKINPSSLI